MSAFYKRHGIWTLFVALFASFAHAQTAELAELKASNGYVADKFGWSVSLAESRALVGAPLKASAGPLQAQKGAAYIYEKEANGSWAQKAQLVAASGESFDLFGFSVSLSGNRTLIGAPGAGDVVNSGSAYLFERQSDGTWVQAGELKPEVQEPGANFGWSVSLFQDRAIASAYRETGSGLSWVFFFERQANGVWLQAAKFSQVMESGFGHSVSLEGDLAIVGAPTDIHGVQSFGAAYLYHRQPNGVWEFSAKLASHEAQADNWFGSSVSLDQGRALIGSPGEDDEIDESLVDSGVGYIFVKQSNGSWVQEKKLTPKGGHTLFHARVGSAVSLSGKRAALSNDGTASGYGEGAVYLFEEGSDGAWNSTDVLLPTIPSDHAELLLIPEFGKGLALAGDLAMVGVPYASNDLDGSVFLFDVEPLSATIPQVSVSHGGFQQMAIDAGHLEAGRAYWLLGSSSGTSPGIVLSDEFLLPLNSDSYFLQTVFFPNATALSNSLGTLDDLGHGAASFSLPSGSSAALIGMTLHHAFIVLRSTLEVTFVSNPIAVEFAP